LLIAFKISTISYIQLINTQEDNDNRNNANNKELQNATITRSSLRLNKISRCTNSFSG